MLAKRPARRYARSMPQQASTQQEAPAQASTDTIQQEAPALAKLLESIALLGESIALVGAFVANSRLRARKSAIKVRGGRARARNARRDERGRYLKQTERIESVTDWGKLTQLRPKVVTEK